MRDEFKQYTTGYNYIANAKNLGWALALIALALNLLWFFQVSPSSAFIAGIALAVITLASSYFAETVRDAFPVAFQRFAYGSMLACSASYITWLVAALQF